MERASFFVQRRVLVITIQKWIGTFSRSGLLNNYCRILNPQVLSSWTMPVIIALSSKKYHIRPEESDIQLWLSSKNIPFYIDQLQAELLELVNEHKQIGYKIDTLAKAAGHDVLRLPPYHSLRIQSSRASL